jgi:hypothetical protein
MKCDVKTMLKVLLGVSVALGLAYLALPTFRAFILASAPVLLVLICPISMLVMMLVMGANQRGGEAKSDEANPACAARDAKPDKV